MAVAGRWWCQGGSDGRERGIEGRGGTEGMRREREG